MSNKRQYSLLDRVIKHIDDGVRTMFATSDSAERKTPAEQYSESDLSKAQKQHIAGLMRINHAGEIAAQGLYRGQALTAKLDNVRVSMEEAASEEEDHLAWCEQRIHELGSHTSYLSPIWYGGAYMMGAFAGLAGDKWSLGFVCETEKQVVRHLQKHLTELPQDEEKSKAIIEQMIIDEQQHATSAENSGAADLPDLIKLMMTYFSKVMTHSAYHL